MPRYNPIISVCLRAATRVRYYSPRGRVGFAERFRPPARSPGIPVHRLSTTRPLQTADSGVLSLEDPPPQASFVGRKVELKATRKRPFFGADLEAVHQTARPAIRQSLKM